MAFPKKNSKSLKIYILIIGLITLITGCADALKRGMIGDTYISTARPAITLSVKNMPLMLAGRGSAQLPWTAMVGGLPISVWLAVYGEGGLAPLAIVAQAQAPENWYFDDVSNKPFTVDQGTEVFNGVTYYASTFIVNPATDPFGALVTGVKPDGEPQLWIVRHYAARFNFDQDKIIMEYREPLPDDITSLSALPLGRANYLREFAQRARESFVVATPESNPKEVTTGYANAVQWQFMNQRFLGTVSKVVVFEVSQ